MEDLDQKRFYSPLHEKWNVRTHLAGAIITLIGLPFLVVAFYFGAENLAFWGSILFGLSMLNMFVSSTLYHAAKTEISRLRFRTLDHISIYFLIAGSYTAYILHFYPSTSGLRFLGIHWIIVLFGVIFKVFYTGKWEFFSTLLYLVLGWMVMFIYKDLSAMIPDDVLFWLVAGGVFYTSGVIFYAINKIPFNHAIWHVFVMAGCFSHVWGLYISL